MLRHLREEAPAAEFLARGDVADMYLHDRERTVRQGIAQHDRGVRESAGIDDGTCGITVLLQEVDERPLVVRLKRHKVGAGLARDLAASGLHFLESRPPVDLRLAHTEEIQIWAVDEKDLHAARPATTRAAARRDGSSTSITSLKRPMRRGRIQRSFPARAFLSRRTKLHTALGSRARVGSVARASSCSSCGRRAGDARPMSSANAVA